MAGRPPGKMAALGMAAKQIMESKGYNPFEAIIEIVQDETTPLDLKLAAHKEMCKYHSPQLKSLDMNIQAQGQLAVKLISFADDAKIIEQQQAIYNAHQAKIAEQAVQEEVIDAEYTKEENE